MARLDIYSEYIPKQATWHAQAEEMMNRKGARNAKKTPSGEHRAVSVRCSPERVHECCLAILASLR